MIRIERHIFFDETDQQRLQSIPRNLKEGVPVDCAAGLFRSIHERKAGLATELYVLKQIGASAGKQMIALEEAREESRALDAALQDLGEAAPVEIAEELSREMFQGMTEPVSD